MMPTVRMPLGKTSGTKSARQIVITASPVYLERLELLRPDEQKLVLDAVEIFRNQSRWPYREIYKGDLLQDDVNIGQIMIRRLFRGLASLYIVYQYHELNNGETQVKLIYTGTYRLQPDGTEKFDDF
jgi:hypothetical protein